MKNLKKISKTKNKSNNDRDVELGKKFLEGYWSGQKHLARWLLAKGEGASVSEIFDIIGKLKQIAESHYNDNGHLI